MRLLRGCSAATRLSLRSWLRLSLSLLWLRAWFGLLPGLRFRTGIVRPWRRFWTGIWLRPFVLIRSWMRCGSLVVGWRPRVVGLRVGTFVLIRSRVRCGSLVVGRRPRVVGLRIGTFV